MADHIGPLKQLILAYVLRHNVIPPEQQLLVTLNLVDSTSSEMVCVKELSRQIVQPVDLDSLQITSLQVGARAVNVLDKYQIDTVGVLMRKIEEYKKRRLGLLTPYGYLHTLRGIADMTYKEIREALEHAGVILGEEWRMPTRSDHWKPKSMCEAPAD